MTLIQSQTLLDKGSNSDFYEKKMRYANEITKKSLDAAVDACGEEYNI